MQEAPEIVFLRPQLEKYQRLLQQLEELLEKEQAYWSGRAREGSISQKGLDAQNRKLQLIADYADASEELIRSIFTMKQIFHLPESPNGSTKDAPLRRAQDEALRQCIREKREAGWIKYSREQDTRTYPIPPI